MMRIPVLDELKSLGVEGYLVGGVVRDFLLNPSQPLELTDLDITIAGDAVAVALQIVERSDKFQILETYPNFGTAKLLYNGTLVLDFASTRTESYAGCGSLPQVEQLGVPLSQDVLRRDFTINTLALSLSNLDTVIDTCGGQADLSARTIRLLKPGSFLEDPSRILRALRFAARLGFVWAEDTHDQLDAFLTAIPASYRGGGERIKTELYRFLSLPESSHKVHGLQFFEEKSLYRLLDTRLPPGIRWPELSNRLTILKDRLSAYWTDELTSLIYLSLVFFSFSEAQAVAAAKQLGLTRSETEIVLKSREFALPEQADPGLIYEAFMLMPFASACVGVLLAADFKKAVDTLSYFKANLEGITLETTGDDILALGIPPGEKVGQLLKALRHAKLKGEVRHKIEELAWIQKEML